MAADDFYLSLPKAELHAHLNGSLSQETLRKLVEQHRTLWPEEEMPADTDLLVLSQGACFDDPFRLFGLVHRVTDHPSAVSLATRDVIRDFAEDGVRYLELRSTPRQVEGKMKKVEYCTAVLEEIVAAREDKSLDIMVKLLLAVDRRRLGELEGTYQLFKQMQAKYPGLVVGLDISGDPRVGDLQSVLPRLKEMKSSGVRLSVHLAEVPNHPETLAVLRNLVPDRLGHATAIHPDLGGCRELWEELCLAKIPVEVCMTSNLTCQTVSSCGEHQAGLYHGAGVPIVVCTDDKGVFPCTMSSEMNLAANTWGWNRQQVFNLSKQAVDHCFATSEEKEALRKAWDLWRNDNQAYFEYQ